MSLTHRLHAYIQSEPPAHGRGLRLAIWQGIGDAATPAAVAANLERLEAVRAGFDGPIRIDGNEGWDIDIARAITPDLLRLGVHQLQAHFTAPEFSPYDAPLVEPIPGVRYYKVLDEQPEDADPRRTLTLGTLLTLRYGPRRTVRVA